jgi:hypothetical protein
LPTSAALQALLGRCLIAYIGRHCHVPESVSMASARVVLVFNTPCVQP